MFIIFLDIDGPLNVISQGHDEFGSVFHEHFINNLKRIVDHTNGKIVIISTWRSAGLDEMRRMWIERGLPGEVIEITPYSMIHTQYYDRPYEKGIDRAIRGIEVKWFLDNWNGEEITNYVILEDDTDFLISQQKNLVLCSGRNNEDDSVEGYGITNNVVDEVLNIFNNGCK